MDVARVRWPLDADALAALRAADRPRLVLVEPGASPPAPAGCCEEWVRVPVSTADLSARLAGLLQRVAAHRAAATAVDDHGVLRHGTAWVVLPPVEARLAAAMVARLGVVVTREALGRAGWPAGPPGRNALDVHVLRLRRRVAPLGLAIHTVRSRGYLMAPSDGGQEGVPMA